MVTPATSFDISPHLFVTRNLRYQIKRFQNRARIIKATAEIVDFATTRVLRKGQHKASDVFRMNVVPDLLPLVAKHLVLSPSQVAPYEVAKEPVQLDSGMIGPS